jgi:DNA ligase-1
MEIIYDNDVEEAFKILSELEGISSRNAKMDKLKSVKGNEVLQKILYLAYSGSKFHVHVDFESLLSQKEELTLAESNTLHNFLRLLSKLEARELTGNAAIEATEMFFRCTSPKAFKWYSRVMNHDLRIGMTDGTVTKVFGNDFWGSSKTETNSYGYLEVMLAHQWEKKKANFKGKALYTEPKYDGYRLAAVIDNSNVTFYSRGGKSQPYTDNLTHVADQLLEAGFDNCMVDGEIIKDNWNGTGVVKKIQSTMKAEDRENLQKITYICFDYIDLTNLTDKKLYKVPFKTRRKQLEAFFKENQTYKNLSLTSSIIVSNDSEIEAISRKHRKEGFEGSMLKDPEGFYEFDKRSLGSLKIKPVHTIDGTIIGFEQGTGKNANRLGAIQIRDAEGVTYRCGQGYTDADRDLIWSQREKLLNTIIEMEAQDETNTVAVASARNAVFIRLRHDREGIL